MAGIGWTIYSEATYIDTLNKGKELSLFNNFSVNNGEVHEKAIIPGSKEKIVDGFRIQLMVASSKEKLEAQKKNIELKLNLKLYILHDAPFYKLYAGDFTEKKKADEELIKVKSSGFGDAWVTKAKVVVDR